MENIWLTEITNLAAFFPSEQGWSSTFFYSVKWISVENRRMLFWEIVIGSCAVCKQLVEVKVAVCWTFPRNYSYGHGMGREKEIEWNFPWNETPTYLFVYMFTRFQALFRPVWKDGFLFLQDKWLLKYSITQLKTFKWESWRKCFPAQWVYFLFAKNSSLTHANFREDDDDMSCRESYAFDWWGWNYPEREVLSKRGILFRRFKNSINRSWVIALLLSFSPTS